ncbi:MAG: tryptophan synthase subunit alpha [Bacteroidales bacterium]|nr:tryptophan synthase subunit alpha [Bacteroidales bacterium]
MNRINRLFQDKPGNILSIYYTAGYPSRDSTVPVIKALAKAGADMIEIGMPFSDPMADGPVIQSSSNKALKNGMSLKLLFDQLKNIRKEVDIPLLLMGYLNPVLQYGMEKFCSDCAMTGMDGIILPDLPLEEYLGESGSILSDFNHYNNHNHHNHHNHHNNPNLRTLFTLHNLHNIFLISPQTSPGRIAKIDSASKGFVYMVSSSSTTGTKGSFTQEQISYFGRIRDMKLKNPSLIGFGISDHGNFSAACEYASGAIIGSAFVKILSETKDMENDIRKFVEDIRGVA